MCRKNQSGCAGGRRLEVDTLKVPNRAVKSHFGNASVLKDGRVVFDIGGNKYRLAFYATA
jgi:mRNA-degrading endonuclease HigB of HigAB toxin-antitoxin module